MERTPVNLIILVTGFIGFLQGVQRFLIGYALVYYEWDLTEFGLVYIFSALAMTIPMIVSGIFTDIKGRKQTIIVSFFLSSIGSISLMISISGTVLFYIIISQVLATISFGIAQVGLTSIMADETTEGFHRTNIFGKQATVKNLASFLGPIMMGVYLDQIIKITNKFDLGVITIDIIQSGFLIIAIIAIAGVFLGTILPNTPRDQIELNKKATITDFTSSQKRMYKAFSIEEMIIGFTSGLVVPFIDYYILTEFRPSPLTWGVIFGISNSTIAIGNFMVGRYSEGFGKGNTIFLLNLFSPLFALGIALVPQFSLVAVFYVLRSGVANAVQPAWNSWFYMYLPDTFRGRSLSTIHISRRLTRAVGTAAGPSLFVILGPMLFPLGCLFYPLAMSIPRKTEISLSKTIAESI
ncbi:MAG: MFS transporter [Candidatus Heimdallarchaeota archaeon]|nr:MFS transporter [Candidatus Heimdallarchaeota archaeon]